MKEVFSQRKKHLLVKTSNGSLLLWNSSSCYIKTENENNDNYSEDYRCSRVLLFLHILRLYKFILGYSLNGEKFRRPRLTAQ